MTSRPSHPPSSKNTRAGASVKRVSRKTLLQARTSARLKARRSSNKSSSFLRSSSHSLSSAPSSQRSSHSSSTSSKQRSFPARVFSFFSRSSSHSRISGASDVQDARDGGARRAGAEAQRIAIREAEKTAQKVASSKHGESASQKSGVAAAHPLEPQVLYRKPRPRRKRRTMKQILLLAGVIAEPAVIKKRILLAGAALTVLLTLILLLVTIGWSDYLVSPQGRVSFIATLFALWTAGFAGLTFLAAGLYAVLIDYRINERRKEIEQVFPDYLQLAAANLAAGMTIDRALWGAVRPRFGVLAQEMEDVAKKTITGRDLETSLHEFAEKYDSIVIKRAVDLICEGTRSGGRMADILGKIAINIQENAILQKEMSANVTTYVIFISFASVLASPFLFGLATQLLAVIQQIAGSIAVDSSSSGSVGLAIRADAVLMDDFRVFSMVILAVTSVMSACIVAVIRKGSVREALPSIPFYFGVSIALYFFSTWALGLLFGGFFT